MKTGNESDLVARLELNDAVFGWGGIEQIGDKSVFLEQTGLTESQLSALVKAQLLIPKRSDSFDAEDVAMGKVFAQAFSWGIRVKPVVYAELGRQMVDQEIDLRHSTTRDLEYGKDVEMTMQMLKNAKMCRSYILDRLFQARIADMKDIKDE